MNTSSFTCVLLKLKGKLYRIAIRQTILYDTICSVIKCQQEHKSRIDENAVLDLILYRKEKKNQEFMYYGEI